MSVKDDDVAVELGPGGRPLKHQLVASALKDSIEQGELKAGDRLEGEVELAQQLAVSRGTVRRALEELAAWGYIRTEKGRGSFVTYEGRPLQESPGWAQALLDLGVATRVELLRLEVINDPVLAIHLGAASSRFLAVDRLRRLDDGTPISLERSRVSSNRRLEELVRDRELAGGSLSQTMVAAGLEVHSGEQWLQASPLDAADAALFQTEPGTVYLHALRVTRDRQGLPVEQVSSILDPAHFSFHVTF